MTHSAQSTSPSVSMYGGASRDFLWERALAQLPVALGDALRVSGLDDPGVLANFPRGTLTELEGKLGRLFPTSSDATSSTQPTTLIPPASSSGSGVASGGLVEEMTGGVPITAPRVRRSDESVIAATVQCGALKNAPQVRSADQSSSTTAVQCGALKNGPRIRSPDGSSSIEVQCGALVNVPRILSPDDLRTGMVEDGRIGLGDDSPPHGAAGNRHDQLIASSLVDQIVVAADIKPTARQDAESAERNRCIDLLASVLRNTDTPMGRLLRENPSNTKLLGGGRRAATLRSHVRCIQKFISWLTVAHGVTFSTLEAAHRVCAVALIRTVCAWFAEATAQCTLVPARSCRH